MAEVIGDVQVVKEVNWKLVDIYTTSLQKQLYVDEVRPNEVISSIDGPSKWRKGWFTVVGAYIQMIIDEMGWIDKDDVVTDNNIPLRPLAKCKTGDDIDIDKEDKPIFPEFYSRIMEMDLEKVNIHDIYQLTNYWCRRDFTRSLNWQEDIDVGKKAIKLMLGCFSIEVEDY